MKLRKNIIQFLTSSMLIVGTITPAIVMTSCSTNSESHKNIKIINPNSSSLINNVEIELGNNFNIEVTIDQGEFTNEQLELIYQNLQWEVQLFDSNNQLENYKLYVNKTDINGVWKITNTNENNINTGISEGHHKIEITATANVNDVVYQGTSQINLTVNYTAPSEQQFQYEYVAAGVDSDLPQEHYTVSGINEANIKGTTLFIPDHYNDGIHGELPVLSVGNIFWHDGPSDDYFEYLHEITSLYISDGIQKLNFALPNSFKSLNSLKLPNSMRYLPYDDRGESKFIYFVQGINFLTNIEFSGNEYFGFIPGANDGSGIVYEGSELASDLSNIVLAVGDVIVPDSIHELDVNNESLCFSYQPVTSISLPAITKIVDKRGKEITMDNFLSYDNNDNGLLDDYYLSSLFSGCLNLQKIILRDHGKNGLLEYQYGNGYDSGILMLKGHQLNKKCTNYIAMSGEELTIPEECDSFSESSYGLDYEYSRIYVNKLYVPAKFKSFDTNIFLSSQFYIFDEPTINNNKSAYLYSETLVNINFSRHDYFFKIYVPNNLLNQYKNKYSDYSNLFFAI